MTFIRRDIIELRPIKEIKLYSGEAFHALFKGPNFNLPTMLIIENGYAAIEILAKRVHAGEVGRNWNASYLILKNMDVLWNMSFRAEVLFDDHKCMFDRVDLLSWHKKEVDEIFYDYKLKFACSDHKIIYLDGD